MKDKVVNGPQNATHRSLYHALGLTEEEQQRWRSYLDSRQRKRNIPLSQPVAATEQKPMTDEEKIEKGLPF